MMKSNKGITLSALVITIVILSIIAAVTITASTNSDITGQAQDAAEDFDNASIKQILDSIYLSEKNKYNSGLITEEQMWTNIITNIEDNTSVVMSAEKSSEIVNVSINSEVIYTISMDNGVEKVE